MAEFENELRQLFKYRSLAGEFGRQTAEDVILHNRLFWQTPMSFNDPFDCNPVFIFGRTPSARRRYVREAAGRVLSNKERWQRRKIRRQVDGESISSVERRLKAGFLEWMNDSAVSCFSLVGDSPLMWSHYANDHKGLCFVFEEQLKPAPFISFEVGYEDVRPSVDLTDLRNIATFKSAILTKAAYWSYERETRMLDYRSGPGPRPFPQTALKGVILGARISPDDENYVVGLVEQRSDPISLQRAQIDERAFALHIT